jgi:hypothetical protein
MPLIFMTFRFELGQNTIRLLAVWANSERVTAIDIAIFKGSDGGYIRYFVARVVITPATEAFASV